MASPLQNNLRDLLHAKHLKATQLEKIAGIAAHSVRNILIGRSKNPSVHTLKAIATALECSVEDILEEKPSLYASSDSPSLSPQIHSKPMPSHAISDPDLFLRSTEAVLQAAKAKGRTLTTEQVFRLSDAVYIFSLKKGLPSPDPDFVEWVMEN